jgi:hypothetical protein
MILSTLGLAIASVRPANFECELVLVSSLRGVAEIDGGMTWARSQIDSGVNEKYRTDDPAMAVSKQAVKEAASASPSLIVIDSAGLKQNHYNYRSRWFINVLQSEVEKTSLGDVRQSLALQGQLTKTEEGGGGVTFGIRVGKNTSAIGSHPIPNAGWPTLQVMGFRDFATSENNGLSHDAELVQSKPISLVISTLSVAETAGLPAAADLKGGQICVCAWGTQIPGRPNLIAFPPTGRAVRYKFGHKDGQWFANLVKVY